MSGYRLEREREVRKGRMVSSEESREDSQCPHPETRKPGRISSEEILFWEEKRVK